jgi:hypothetical protein
LDRPQAFAQQPPLVFATAVPVVASSVRLQVVPLRVVVVVAVLAAASFAP